MRIPANHTTTAPALDYYVEARDRFTGDVATARAGMLRDHVRESRQLDREQARVEAAHLRLVQAAQVGDLREEADKLRDAGMVRGASLIFGGGLSIASGVATASTTNTGARATDAATSTTPNADVPTQKAGIDWPGVLEGGADSTKGGGELWAAHVDRLAAHARTRATEHEHQAGES